MRNIDSISNDLLPDMTVRQIVERLRKQWACWPRKHAAIYRHSIRVQLPGGRFKTLIKCAGCSEQVPSENIEAHHRNPVGRLNSNSIEDVSAYAQRMFCSVKEIEPLCHACHQKVSKQQLKEIKNVSIN